MKLWVKLSCSVLIITMLVLSACLYTYAAWQTERILTNAEQQAIHSLSLFCANMKSIERISPSSDTNDIVSRSVVRYYFSSYAHLFDNNESYSLVQSGSYLYNTCPYDPISQLPLREGNDNGFVTRELGGKIFFAAQTISVFSQDYVIYLCTDISSAWDQAQDTTRLSMIFLAVAAAVIMLAVPSLVRHTLRPMDELRRTTESIAGGEYALRARISSNDEVAALAASFNNMAAAVEEKIGALTEESERRRLLLGALAHELRTPMTAIIGFADSLDKLPLTEDQRHSSAKQIAIAGRRTERMADKLMKLLSLDKQDSLDRSPFLVSELAQDISALYGDRVRMDIQAKVIYGDRDLITSLLQNLINNAINASGEDDIIDVVLARNHLTVTDHGRGIPQEHIARLTEPFYRVDKARSRKNGGAGLGLSLCKAIAKAHEGEMIIDSVLGRGTSVTVTFTEGSNDYE